MAVAFSQLYPGILVSEIAGVFGQDTSLRYTYECVIEALKAQGFAGTETLKVGNQIPFYRSGSNNDMHLVLVHLADSEKFEVSSNNVALQFSSNSSCIRNNQSNEKDAVHYMASEGGRMVLPPNTLPDLKGKKYKAQVSSVIKSIILQ